MRILYFSREYNTHDYRFLSAIRDSEHEIGFLQLERSSRQLESRPLPRGVDKVEWGGGEKNAKWFHIPRFVTELREIIRTFKPDLIQAGPVQRPAFIAALAGFHPLVTMSWGYDLLFDVNRSPIWKWATRFTLRRSDALVVDCETTKNIAVDHGMDGDRIVAFPWGANIKKFTPHKDKTNSLIRKRLGWDNNEFVLLSTRTWDKIYGVDDLTEAFVQVAKCHTGVRLLMLGDGPLAPKVKKIFMDGEVEEFVHLPGQVSQQDLPDYYQAADLYISSSHSDGTSISMLEAIASGIPVLLTDIPGNREWVFSPGDFGWLYKDGDVDDLVRAVTYAYENRLDLPEMGKSARQVSLKRGDWAKNSTKLFEAYQIALS